MILLYPLLNVGVVQQVKKSHSFSPFLLRARDVLCLQAQTFSGSGITGFYIFPPLALQISCVMVPIGQ